jgi:hypothetical protein
VVINTELKLWHSYVWHGAGAETSTRFQLQPKVSAPCRSASRVLRHDVIHFEQELQPKIDWFINENVLFTRITMSWRKNNIVIWKNQSAVKLFFVSQKDHLWGVVAAVAILAILWAWPAFRMGLRTRPVFG